MIGFKSMNAPDEYIKLVVGGLQKGLYFLGFLALSGGLSGSIRNRKTAQNVRENRKTAIKIA